MAGTASRSIEKTDSEEVRAQLVDLLCGPHSDKDERRQALEAIEEFTGEYRGHLETASHAAPHPQAATKLYADVARYADFLARALAALDADEANRLFAQFATSMALARGLERFAPLESDPTSSFERDLDLTISRLRQWAEEAAYKANALRKSAKTVRGRSTNLWEQMYGFLHRSLVVQCARLCGEHWGFKKVQATSGGPTHRACELLWQYATSNTDPPSETLLRDLKFVAPRIQSSKATIRISNFSNALGAMTVLKNIGVPRSAYSASCTRTHLTC